MATTARNATAALVAAAMTVMAAPSAAAGLEGPTILLRVVNEANLSPELLLGGEEYATRIFAAIGVRIIWVNDDSAEDQLPDALHLRLLLLSRKTADERFANERMAEAVVGQAYRDARRAYIFTDRIAALTLRYEWDRATMLGYALAHETGHLVLPFDSHSRTGIMKADLYLHSKSLQRFTKEQGAQIRARLAAAAGSGTDENADASVTGR